jgi:hypothetical protein
VLGNRTKPLTTLTQTNPTRQDRLSSHFSATLVIRQQRLRRLGSKGGDARWHSMQQGGSQYRRLMVAFSVSSDTIFFRHGNGSGGSGSIERGSTS